MKRRMRTRSRSRPDSEAPPTEDALSLNVRVKERETEERPKSRLGALFGRDGVPGASDIKETLTRPISSLFRRPPSASGVRKQSEASPQRGIVSLDSSSAGGKTPVGDTAPSMFANGKINLSDQAATAPHINVNRISSIYPAELSYMKNANLWKSGDIDVSFLARFLCPEDEVVDEAIPWNWDSLFASVSTELKEEWAMEEEEANIAVNINQLSSGNGL